MPRTYLPNSRSSRKRNYDETTFEKAVTAVASKRISSYEAEKLFKIPRRTILDRFNKSGLKMGPPTKLTEVEEQKLIAEIFKIPKNALADDIIDFLIFSHLGTYFRLIFFQNTKDIPT